MTIANAAITHRTAPLSLLERFAYRKEEVADALHRFVAAVPVSEAAILATCDRTEVYDAFPGEPDPWALARFLAEDRQAAVLDLQPALATTTGMDVAGHLFRVSAGLDSMVVGEAEIQGQVRAAYAVAREANTLGPELDPLFRRAIGVGPRVRRETPLGSSRRSLGTRAVDVAITELRGLAGRSALVIGAGKIAGVVVERLLEERTALEVCSRTEERAARIVGGLGKVLAYRDLLGGLSRADLMIWCTAAPHRVIELESLRAVMSTRPGRPLLIVDLSVPRAVDAGAADIPDLRLFDLEDLGEMGVQDAAALADALVRAAAIVSEEQQRFTWWVAERAKRAAVGRESLRAVN